MKRVDGKIVHGQSALLRSRWEKRKGRQWLEKLANV